VVGAVFFYFLWKNRKQRVYSILLAIYNEINQGGTDMDKGEAKERITAEFIAKYNEWLNEKANLTKLEYAQKYGFYKTEKVVALKDNLTAVTYFQSNIYKGKWAYQWVREGYEFEILKQLAHDGFLSHTQYYNLHKHPDTDYFYISQKTAKLIYKEARR
jgi:hypothetical protein